MVAGAAGPTPEEQQEFERLDRIRMFPDQIWKLAFSRQGLSVGFGRMRLRSLTSSS
jgi:hypothetical protein